MADDDEMNHEEIGDAGDDFEPEMADAEPGELDEEALDEDALGGEDEEFSDDEFGGGEEDEFGDDESEEDDLTDAPRRAQSAPKDSEEDDDDDDLLTPDDVEADLDTILKDRLVANDEGGDEDDEAAEVDDPRSEPGDRLQPKRPDEQLCSNCFLLVRAKAPNCPMDDDACPIFS